MNCLKLRKIIETTPLDGEFPLEGEGTNTFFIVSEKGR